MEEPFPSAIECNGVNYVRQTGIHTAEPLVPDPIVFEVEMAIKKLKIHKSQAI